jgi:class 3 adenylate cyclase
VDSALARVEQVYGDFNVRADETVRLLEAGETDAAQALEKALDRDEVRFEQTIEGVQQVFDRSFQQAVDTIEKHESQVLHLNLVITLVGVVFGVVFAALLTARLTAPVRRLIDTICLVERGDLDVRLEPTTDDEIGQLTKSFNEMVGELKLKDTIEQTFGKYVDARIVQHLLDESGGPPTGGEKQVMTVLFGDVEGYGDAVQMLSPEALVELTNQYLTQVSALIARCGGIIDKYIGTMVMAFWGRPFTDEEEHAHLACAAALEQVAQLDSLQRLVAVGVGLEAVDLDLRIGLATGPLVAGNMGSEQAKSYTVMGDTANIAFRLKGANKAYGTRILIGESLQPVSRCGGGRRFTFNICGQLCLVQRCKSDRGRHSFVLGGRLTCGPNVFLDCSATRPFSSSEPHSSLVVGSLYDNVKAPIALRFAKSNPVRWMGIFNYLWNCEGGFLCQKPPVGQNYAFGQIGIHALVYNTGLQDHKYENGHIESWDEHVEPQRLYLAQLKKRLGEEAVSNIG